MSPAQYVKYMLEASKKDESEGTKAENASPEGNSDKDKVGLFPQKCKDQVGLFPPNSIPNNRDKTNEHLRHFDMDQSVEEMNENGSYQPPDQHNDETDHRYRTRSPETSSPREWHRYNVNDRRGRYKGYFNRSDGYYNDQLTPFEKVEVKLFSDKIAYFDGLLGQNLQVEQIE